ncbi:MAG: ABC transporter permease [Actinomycetaceae bacterium]|nr:ABC transporter permease [Actinomycetaceae bacterium]
MTSNPSQPSVPQPARRGHGAPNAEQLSGADTEPAGAKAQPTGADAHLAAANSLPSLTPSSQMSKALALVRAEAALLKRNRAHVFLAVLVPVCMPLWLTSLLDVYPESMVARVVSSMVVSFTLLMVAYYIALAVYVSRRQELVLKRLRTGECSDATILIACAVPSIAISLAAVAVTFVACVAVLDVSAPVRPELVVWGTVAGCVVVAAIGAVTAIYTRTTESAAVTYLPFFILGILGTDGLFPVENMPGWLSNALLVIPTNGFSRIVSVGWTGTNGDGEALDYGSMLADCLLCSVSLAAWMAIAALIVRKRFVWDPRS